MASVLPYPHRKGWWRAQIRLKGVRRSQVFPSKGSADAWVRQNETAILAGERNPPDLKLADLFNRYAKEVSSTKKGARWEVVRLNLLGRDRIAQIRLKVLSTAHLSDWQQRRLQAVSGASVRREMTLLHHVFAVAVREWKWLSVNPLTNLRRPKGGKPKERVAEPEEIEQIMAVVSPTMQRVITFALETGMRCSEIANLREGDIRGRVAILRDTKNGTQREVPLSEKALSVVPQGPVLSGIQDTPDTVGSAGSATPKGTIFPLSPGSISTMFLRAAREVKAEGLTFHCLRRTAATNISKRLDVWQLCSMFGWADPRIPLKHYYKADTSAIAERLD